MNNTSTEKQSLVQSHEHLSKEVLEQKLQKAIKLADDPKNDKFFEIKKKEGFYIKDALDKKHGFYFLRVGTEDKSDLSLKVKMFVQGDQVQSSES